MSKPCLSLRNGLNDAVHLLWKALVLPMTGNLDVPSPLTSVVEARMQAPALNGSHSDEFQLA